MPEIAIVDASVLIALEKIELLDILCGIYSQIILPEAVVKEFGTPTISCYSVRKVKSPMVELLIRNSNLGKGESGMKIIVDDLKARKVAETLDLNFTGTIGILLKAERYKLIDSAYDKTKELKSKGFYVADQLLEEMSSFKVSV